MAKKAAKIFGIIFIILGVLGFVMDPVIGVFEVNMLHNVVHIVLGLVLFMAARGEGANKALKVVGIIYLIVALLGFFMMSPDGMLLGILEVNGADNWLHLILGVILFGVGMGGKKPMMSSMGSSGMPSSGGMGGGSSM